MYAQKLKLEIGRHQKENETYYLKKLFSIKNNNNIFFYLIIKAFYS